jgi:hypothetical protein
LAIPDAPWSLHFILLLLEASMQHFQRLPGQPVLRLLAQ